jgi:signal transduction histidine kinase
MAAALYATMNGSIPEAQPSYAILGAAVVAPLLTIPMFRAAGDTSAWSIAAPALCSVISAAGYHAAAVGTARWREVRAQQEELVAALRAKLADRDRMRLAQDLHDSVGSVLGVVALYGDLIERNCEQPSELRAIAGMVREATREGLTDLRSVIGAIAPASTDVTNVTHALRPILDRVAATTGAKVELCMEGEGDAAIDGTARLTIVRVFQEAVANAAKHAAPSEIRVVLRAEGDDVHLAVSDDGEGFPMTEPVSRGDGRGLRGMRARVEELGGSFGVESAPGRGTRIHARVPRNAENRA